MTRHKVFVTPARSFALTEILNDYERLGWHARATPLGFGWHEVHLERKT